MKPLSPSPWTNYQPQRTKTSNLWRLIHKTQIHNPWRKEEQAIEEKSLSLSHTNKSSTPEDKKNKQEKKKT